MNHPIENTAMRRLLLLPLAALLLGVLALPARAEDKDSILADELRLKNAFQNTDGASLVAFLQTRASGEASAEKLAELIEALGSPTPATRQKACAELVAIGSPAVPHLRRTARDADSPDSASLAARILRVLEDEPGNVTGAAVRLLASRRPANTAAALLAYLPHAENESVMEEIKAALAGTAYIRGKPDPAVLKALSDEHPLRRANAIVALCAGGIAEPRAALRKLLIDPAPSVRLRASLALAQAYDAKAVSTLIALLADLPAEQGREVEGFLNDLAGEQAPKITLGNDDISRNKARDAWAKWWLDSEQPKLLDEIKNRTLTEERMAKAQALIEKLGDDSFKVRQDAETELHKMGGTIMPLLRQALKNPDLEIRNRSQKVLTQLETDKNIPLSPVVPRLLALRKPKGAVEAILAYIPFADDESLVDELQVALNMVAFPKGKAHQAVIKALADKVPARRAAAASALCHGPLADHLPQVRQLLRDRDNNVRLRVALALAGAREPEAVPVLIGLVGELAPEASASAEDYLLKLARDNPPKDLPDGDDNRKKRSAVWEKWWNDNKARVAMVDRFTPEIRQRYLGYTLLIQSNNNQIVEMDNKKQVRMTMTGLMSPWDAHWLSSNRLLVAEYNGQKVTERNLKGEVMWEKKLDFYPMQCERLKNGHTFIVGQNVLLQVDRGGREVYRITRGQHDIRSARRLRNGQIVVVTSNRQILRLDRTGKELKNVQIPSVYYYQNEILDNGNVLIPLGWNNQLIEYNSDGKQVWSVQTEQPMHAVRLPNGNTVVSSQNWPYKYLELDKTGKKIDEHVTNTYVFRVRRR
jgi:HEAT repeat protein